MIVGEKILTYRGWGVVESFDESYLYAMVQGNMMRLAKQRDGYPLWLTKDEANKLGYKTTVTKEFVGYVNVYLAFSRSKTLHIFETPEEANLASHPDRVACVEVRGTYQCDS